MNTHHLFKPLSSRRKKTPSFSIEVPAENYTSLSVVFVSYFFAFLFLRVCSFLKSTAEQFRRVSLTANRPRISWNHAHENLNHEPYSIQKLLSVFLISLIACIGLLYASIFAVSLPLLKADSIRSGESGVRHLSDGIQSIRSSQFAEALRSMRACSDDFTTVQSKFDSIHPAIRGIITISPSIGKQYVNSKRAIRIGIDLCTASIKGLTAYESIAAKSDAESLPVPVIIAQSVRIFETIEPLIRDAADQLESLDVSALPKKYQPFILSSRDELKYAIQTFGVFNSVVHALSDSIGSHTLRRYLLLFQNNAELRPTGGFIGSIALVDMLDGELKRVEIPPGGPYDLRGSFHEHLIPPKPLRIVADEWQFQDANWWADFPVSAQKILWFYEKSGGPTVDGVIAINASVMPKLLSLTGPLVMRAYSKDVSADSVLSDLQKAVEVEYDKTLNKPKQIIADAFPLILKAFSDKHLQSSPEFIALILESFKNKDIQFYFRNADYEQLAKKLNVAGEMKAFNGDYSMIVSSNIGGGKSDAVLTSDISHVVSLQTDGSLQIQITLHREHHGNRIDQFTGMAHNDYIRFYAPPGSTLLDAHGFSEMPIDAYKQPDKQRLLRPDPIVTQKKLMRNDALSLEQWEEFDRTVFGGWIITKPSSSTDTVIRYRLPFTMNDSAATQTSAVYALLVQRQSGSTISSYTLRFDMPTDIRPLWTYGGMMNATNPQTSPTYHTNDFLADNYAGFGIAH